jgi:hypothetical protein
MAYEESQTRISLDADASIGVYTGPPGARGTTPPYSGMQYRFVKVTGAHAAGLSTNATNEWTVGVLQNKPQVVGSASEVAISGVTRIQLAGTVTAGAGLKSNGTGQAVAATAGTDTALAIALAGGASGQLVPALLLRAK